MTQKQIKEKCTIDIDIEITSGLSSSNWFYLIPTIKCMKIIKYYKIEFDFLIFYLYAGFSKHEDD